MMNADLVVKPAYKVERLPESHVTERTIYKYVRDKDGISKRTETVVKDKGGFLIKTMKNGSFRVRDISELRALKLDGRPALIHTESGEPVPIGMAQTMQSVVDVLERENE